MCAVMFAVCACVRVCVGVSARVCVWWPTLIFFIVVVVVAASLLAHYADLETEGHGDQIV